MQLFTTARIKLNEMLDDMTAYTQKVYKQAQTLYTNASPWGQFMNVIANIAQMMLYYIEDSITELNIRSASRPSSIYGLARIAGHNPTRAIAALGDLVFIGQSASANYIGQPIIVPNFTRIKCKDNNLTYTMILGKDEIIYNLVSDKDKFYTRVIQGEIDSQQFTGTGLALQSYECNMAEGKYIDNFYVNVFVNSEKWTKYESLYDMPKGATGYVCKTGITSGIDVYFGTNYFGVTPVQGATMNI